jgi:glycosyltransferase involved in cell wall biosynthesis
MNRTILLIPHYNNPEGLNRSLASIDVSENIDVIIVDDGSRKALINEKALNTSFRASGTIKYIYLAENQGIERALNAGLDYILSKEYEYIARLDSDDECIGNRFKIQESFLDIHQDIVLVGSNAIAVSPEGEFLFNIIKPEHSEDIRNKMFLNSMFMHPSVMYRSGIVKSEGYYPLNYPSAEDYAYFFRIAKKYNTANIQQFLIRYEINPAGISISRRKEQVASRIRVIRDNFKFGIYPVYGLIRNYILYLIPQKLITFIKKARG